MPDADDFMRSRYETGDLGAEDGSGDKERSLKTLRAILAAKIDAGPCSHCGGPRGEMAGMTSAIKELRAIIDEIDALPNPAEVTFLDRIREQHSTRMPDAPDSGTARKSQARKQGGRRP